MCYVLQFITNLQSGQPKMSHFAPYKGKGDFKSEDTVGFLRLQNKYSKSLS